MANAKKKTPVVKQWRRPHNNFCCGSVDIDYNTEYDCGSDCDDMCRCGQIVNAQVIEVNVDYLAFEFAGGMTNKRANRNLLKDRSAYYAIDRFIRLQELSCESFTVQSIDGYYGEEIGDVVMDTSLFIKICERIEAIEKMNDTDRIRQALIDEYGFLLEDIEGKDFKLVTVKFDKIKQENDSYSKKLNQKVVESYNEHELPLGVLIDNGNSYRLIDGYHRLAAAKKEGLKRATFYVCGKS